MRNHQRKNDIGSITLSLILHIILFGLLIFGSLYYKMDIMGGGEGDGEAISAVMVNTGAAAQEWGRLQQQKKGQAEKPTQPKQQEPDPQAQKQALLEEQKRQQELARQKHLEEQRQKQIEQQKQLEAQKQQERLAEQQKQREEQARIALEKQQEAKAKQETEAARLKAEAEAKRLAAQAKKAEEEAKAEAKAKAEAEKRKAQQAALDDFLNGGDIGGSATVGSNTNNAGSQGNGAASGAGDGVKIGDRYAGVIKKEIQRRFLTDPSFRGKVCRIRIQLERDGTISNYQRVSGPDDICSAAMIAVARTKKVPAAPSEAIYSKYKAPIIDFDWK
ncbi:cell envelope integrity protein TolA [Avibacterium paragallinarum]|uniref:cell envelope integrity protein TolA n=1 Tax=Avibacterium paragallinarum TaxID=728 RepID=UPI000614C1A6|nr:cell envelope integrity protein TolA [Avibacterium paragallinarum]KAA6208828.1 cell envelope integrity protein TolA [Avibacterium paragallinarum]KKB01049.1 cell envelope biogenesis protein TolA [Avibacterium paragallinarum]RZN70780.1 cell envelope integrity protein TolA [Avibacterium paragallinarum]